MGFQTPTDIANRGIQHIGGTRIDPTLGFTENSKNAAECAFVYDKVRRAELRRNIWRFATRRVMLRAIDTNTLLLAPALWVATTTYFVGSIVSDETGYLWMSIIPSNLGNQPQNSTTWAPYFGPLTVSLYDSTATYSAGEVVYTAAGDGTNRVFVSLQNVNSDNPATASAWSATATYLKNQVVTYLSTAYMSLIDLNINQVPSAAPALWAVGTTYASGAKVGGSDGLIYTSLVNSNLAHDPTLDGGVNWSTAGVLNPWTTVFVGGTGSLKWLQVGGKEFPNGVGLSELNIIYPLNSGPSSQSLTRNVFRLPAGFLKVAPQDPKAGSISFLGTPGNLQADDWVYEGNYIVSIETNPIMQRFIADVTDVSTMDDMFCEGLAARIGYEVCEAITQSTEKRAACRQAYDKAMGEARTVNGIETGPVAPPLDDFIACRM